MQKHNFSSKIICSGAVILSVVLTRSEVAVEREISNCFLKMKNWPNRPNLPMTGRIFALVMLQCTRLLLTSVSLSTRMWANAQRDGRPACRT